MTYKLKIECSEKPELVDGIERAAGTWAFRLSHWNEAVADSGEVVIYGSWLEALKEFNKTLEVLERPTRTKAFSRGGLGLR